MKVLNPDLLATCRTKRCAVCSKTYGVTAHHFHAKGMGGGSQLDIPENLLPVCVECHDKIHRGKIMRVEVLALIAARLGKTPEECQQVIWDTLAMNKERQ